MLDYAHILGATDFSELGDLALRKAGTLAATTGARLTAVTVLPQLEVPSPLLPNYDVTPDASRIEQAKAAAIAALEERIPEAAREADIDIGYDVRVGDPATEILAFDVRYHPDLIVLATHGRRGWSHWILGSVSERVLRMAHADVLAVREYDEDDEKS